MLQILEAKEAREGLCDSWIGTCSDSARAQGLEALHNGQKVQTLNISFKPKVHIW